MNNTAALTPSARAFAAFRKIYNNKADGRVGVVRFNEAKAGAFRVFIQSGIPKDEAIELIDTFTQILLGEEPM